MILIYHDTISSFCACKKDWNNRFLLMFTFIVSGNLLCMHFEEFNTRNWSSVTTEEEDRKLFIMFLCELVCIVSLPLVGIFYTRGNNPDPEKRNKDYQCPYGTCKIETSEKLHQLGAYVFLIGLCVTSIMWSSHYLDYFSNHHEDYYPLAIFFMVWSCLQLFLGLVFVIIQLILGRYYLVKEAFEPPEIFRSLTDVRDGSNSRNSREIVVPNKYKQYSSVDDLDDNDDNDIEQETKNLTGLEEMDTINHEEEVGAEQQKYRHIATRLRYFSFALEGIVAGSVILMVTFSTLVRKWFIG